MAGKKPPEIRRMPLASLNPAPYNPRRISTEAKHALTKSIERFGAVQPIVWNEKTNTVVGGHRRMEIMLEQGVHEAEVVVVRLSLADEKALNIALNSDRLTGEFTSDLDAMLTELSKSNAALFEDLQLGALFQVEPPNLVDPVAEWTGMPEYHSADESSFQSVRVHFARQEDVEAFETLVGQKIGKVRAIWYPEAPIGSYADKRYAAKP
jgi:hypothetical protein